MPKEGWARSFWRKTPSCTGRSLLKEIQARHVKNSASRRRFVAEAEITGNLEHPGIVPVYGLGTHDDGRPFYTMRFIKGEDLAAAIRRFHSAVSPSFDGIGVSLAAA